MKTLAIRIVVAFALTLGLALSPAGATDRSRAAAAGVLVDWYGLILELVRHTPTYSPPVASRAFAYLGIAAFESAAGGNPDLRSLSGQVNALTSVPARQAGLPYDEAVAIHATLTAGAEALFGNTGPTGQRAMRKLAEKRAAELAEGIDPETVARSVAWGQDVAAHILAWAQTDGGAVVENLGFPADYKLTPGPAHWVPTSPINLQQTPLLPTWGSNRTFVLKDGSECALPPPPDYSEAEGSAFRIEAEEVRDAVQNLTKEQEVIARFWSDDPMLSPTPPGHWISIALQIFKRDEVGLEQSVEVLARLGIALADAFIGCWHEKYRHDLVRPVTYIRRVIDPAWEPVLITPPFPEYPSGHSTQSGAAEVVLAGAFGEPFAFDDATHERDGIAPRHYASFREAADEAGISRLYGGIHFRAAIDRGLDQGRCIGARVNMLVTRQ